MRITRLRNRCADGRVLAGIQVCLMRTCNIYIYIYIYINACVRAPHQCFDCVRSNTYVLTRIHTCIRTNAFKQSSVCLCACMHMYMCMYILIQFLSHSHPNKKQGKSFVRAQTKAACKNSMFAQKHA
jgi:hypothetical protein